MVRYCIVGHGAYDHNLFEFDINRFSKYSPDMSIKEALEYSTTPDNFDSICDFYDANFGGPILTVGQWLAQRGDIVSAVTIVGKDQISDKYVSCLKKAGINTDKIRRFDDVNLAQCLYVHNENDDTMDPPLWEDDVTDKFKRLPFSTSLRDFLARHNVLVLPITEPLAGKKAAETYVQERGDGFLAYIPGPYLTDGSVDFSRTYFREVLKLSNLLQLNEAEAEVIVNQLSIGNVDNLSDLFILEEDQKKVAPRLEYLALTLGSKGSKLFWIDKVTRSIEEHCLSALSIEGSDVESFATPQGAGDAYSGVLIRSIMDNKRIISNAKKRKRIGAVQDAHRLAREAAAGMCKIRGALNRNVVNAGSTDLASDRIDEE